MQGAQLSATARFIDEELEAQESEVGLLWLRATQLGVAELASEARLSGSMHIPLWSLPEEKCRGGARGLSGHYLIKYYVVFLESVTCVIFVSFSALE